MDTEQKHQARLEMVRRFEQSTLSKKEFCRLEGVPRTTLDYWRRRAQHSKVAEAGFIEVVTTEDATSTAVEVYSQTRQPQVELELPFGVKLRFFGVGAEVLGR